MNKILAVLALAVLAACGDPPQPEEQAASFQGGVLDERGALSLGVEAFRPLLADAFAPGIEVHHVVDPRGELAVVVADLAQLEAGIAGIDRYPTGVSTELLMADAARVLVLGSGFVTELNALTPVGLLQIDGRSVSKIQRHGYTRVLGVDDHRLGVVDHLKFERGLFPSALQAGPGVVEAGQLDIAPRDLQRTPYFRALVGTCGERGLFAATLLPMHLYSVGELLLEFAAAQDLACDEVVNLAGDREAVLAVRRAEGDVLYIGNPRTRKASMVMLHSGAQGATR